MQSSVQRVNNLVSEIFGINGSQLRSRSRKQHLVFARMVFACVCNKHFKISQVEIAKYLNITQPTVNHYLNNALNELKTNDVFLKNFRSVYRQIENQENRKKVKENKDRELTQSMYKK